MNRWSKRNIRLPENHGWRSKPGNKVFVADRGKLMFEFPADWIMDPTRDPSKESMRFYDKPEPDDDIRLEITIIDLNPAYDWKGLPVQDLVEDAVKNDTRGVDRRGPMRSASRADLDVAWVQIDFTDPGENRKAHSRLCYALGSNVLTFITMDFWPEHRSKVNSVWNGVMGTLKLGEYIADPTLISRSN